MVGITSIEPLSWSDAYPEGCIYIRSERIQLTLTRTSLARALCICFINLSNSPCTNFITYVPVIALAGSHTGRPTLLRLQNANVQHYQIKALD